MPNSWLEQYPETDQAPRRQAGRSAFHDSRRQGRDTALCANLSEDDLLFLRTDITDPAVVDDWIENLRKGTTITILAELTANWRLCEPSSGPGTLDATGR